MNNKITGKLLPRYFESWRILIAFRKIKTKGINTSNKNRETIQANEDTEATRTDCLMRRKTRESLACGREGSGSFLNQSHTAGNRSKLMDYLQHATKLLLPEARENASEVLLVIG